MGKAPPVIYQYSISRSGSTLIWQILHYLFPEHTIRKKHQPPREVVKTVISYRDPRDRVVSKWRKGFQQHKERVLSSKEQLNRLLTENERHFSQLKKYLEKHTEGQDYIVLCYEKFYENFDYIYQKLEAFFGIVITEEQRQHIAENFNVNKNKDIADSLPTFHNIHRPSNIHGNHICPATMGAPGGWRTVIHPNLQKHYLSQLEKQLTYFSKLT